MVKIIATAILLLFWLRTVMAGDVNDAGVVFYGSLAIIGIGAVWMS